MSLFHCIVTDFEVMPRIPVSFNLPCSLVIREILSISKSLVDKRSHTEYVDFASVCPESYGIGDARPASVDQTCRAQYGWGKRPGQDIGVGILSN